MNVFGRSKLFSQPDKADTFNTENFVLPLLNRLGVSRLNKIIAEAGEDHELKSTKLTVILNSNVGVISPDSYDSFNRDVEGLRIELVDAAMEGGAIRINEVIASFPYRLVYRDFNYLS